MPQFSERSKSILNTCHPNLIFLFEEIVKHFDCSILHGQRGEEEQNGFFHQGLSKLKYPDSKHNKIPSMAVDAAPYPIDWMDTERFYYFAGFVMYAAIRMGIRLRWGGDWDGDTNLHDQKFMDFVHFELMEE